MVVKSLCDSVAARVENRESLNELATTHRHTQYKVIKRKADVKPRREGLEHREAAKYA